MYISDKIRIQSVSEITTSIKNMMEQDFRFVHIQGEVTNLRCPFSGHLYFSLKDTNSQIKAVLFKGKKRYLETEIKDGKQIICHGKVSVYEPRGEYQIIVDTVDDCGFGNLQAQFELLKRRLLKKGFFDQGIKKPLPHYPESLVVVTSPSGAALFDFLKIASLRDSFTDITIYPVRVQGAGSAEEISAALDRINSELDTDLIVMCRGGGSIEDLWAFNEECVAQAMYRSTIPIITGIGHEIDTTIADYCADYRASTPTGVAELIFPEKEDLQLKVFKIKKELIHFISTFVKEKEYRIRLSERILGDLDSVFTHHSLRLDLQVAQLTKVIQHKISCSSSILQNISTRFQNQLPSAKIKFQEQRLFYAKEKLKLHMDGIIELKRAEFGKHMVHLDAVSPLSTLARGYSIVSKKGAGTGPGEIVARSEQVSIGETVGVRLHKGKLECKVIDKA